MPFIFFFFNDTATTEIYTLSLHDALPIWQHVHVGEEVDVLGDRGHRPDRHPAVGPVRERLPPATTDRKSTRLNSSHSSISYAVFCLKKKKKTTTKRYTTTTCYTSPNLK